MSTLSITARTDGGGTVHIHPIGEIDTDNAYDLREVVSGLLATDRPKLIKVDMAAIPITMPVSIMTFSDVVRPSV